MEVRHVDGQAVFVGQKVHQFFQIGAVSGGAHLVGEVGYVLDLLLGQPARRGVVFTEEDMRRIANTWLELMWNGDEDNPRTAASRSRLGVSWNVLP